MNRSSDRKPLELVDRYLQAVRFWLPRGQHEDLVAELAEDLRSQVEAKETELGHPVDESEVSALLKRCGHPIVVASRLGPQRHLIGPTLFPIYQFVLKMVLLWILVPVFLFIVGPASLANAGDKWGIALLQTFGDLWSGAFVAAGVITLVFAVLERTHAGLGVVDRWNPSSLPPLQKQERKPSQVQTVREVIFGFFGLVWLLLLPHYPVLVLGPTRTFLQAAPMWHTFYVPIVLLAIAALIRSGIMLARPQWRWFTLLAPLLQTVFSLVVLKFVLDAAQPSNGDWHPFVVLANAAKNSPQAIRVAAIVNVSIVISLASTWIGLCIGGVVQIWQLLRYVRKGASHAGQPASLQVR